MRIHALILTLFLPLMSFAAVPDPACSQQKFADYFLKQDKVGLEFIVDRCAYLGLNQLLPTKSGYEAVKMSLVHLAVLKSWPDFLDKLLKIQDVDPTLKDQRGQTPLAVAWGLSLPMFERLLQHPRVDINGPVESDGRTLLHQVILANDAEQRLPQLLKYSQLNVNARLKDGRTSLWIVYQIMRLRNIRLILIQDSRVDFTVLFQNRSLLVQLAGDNSLEALDEVIQFGKLDVNKADPDSMTALEMAARRNHLAVVQKLVEKYQAKITPQVVSRTYSEKAQSSLLYLLSRSEYDINQSSGLLIDAIRDGRMDVIHALMSRPEFDFQKNQIGRDAISVLVRLNPSSLGKEKALELLNQLLSKPGVDIATPSARMENIAHWIAVSSYSDPMIWARYLEVLRSLPQIDLNLNNREGWTPLCLALRNEQTKRWNSGKGYFDFLMEHPKLDPNVNCGKTSPWLWALAQNRTEERHALQLHPHFDVNQLGDVNGPIFIEQKLPLQSAIQFRDDEAFELLLSIPHLNLNALVNSEKKQIPLIEWLFRLVTNSETDYYSAYFERLLVDLRLDRSPLGKMRGSYNCNLLMYAAWKDRTDLFEEALQSPDIDILARGACHPRAGEVTNILEIAVRKNRLDWVQRFYPKYPDLMRGKQSDRVGDGYAFDLALQTSNISIIEHFVTHGYVEKIDPGQDSGWGENSSVLSLAVARQNQKVLGIALKVPALDLNRQFAVLRPQSKSSYFTFDGIVGLAAHVGWVDGVKTLLADKRVNSKTVSDALMTLMEYEQFAFDSPRFAEIFQILFSNPKFDVNYRECCNAQYTLLARAIAQKLPMSFIEKFLAHKNVKTAPALYRAFEVGNFELGTRLVKHPSFDPMSFEYPAGLVRKDSREWYNLWASHPKARPGVVGDVLIVELRRIGWAPELLKALDTYSGDWNESLPWYLWEDLHKSDPKGARDFLMALMAKKNRPPEKQLSKLLELVLKTDNSEELALELVTKYKGWDLNQVDKDPFSEESILVFASRKGYMRLLEWSLRNREVVVISEKLNFLDWTLCYAKSLDQFDMTLSLRRKDFTEAHLKSALDTASRCRPLDEIVAIAKRLLPEIKDWSELADTLLPIALKTNWMDLIPVIFERDQVSTYKDIRIDREMLLSWTVSQDRLDLMEMFLKTGRFDVNRRWYDEDVPLITAAKLNRIEFVIYLLKVKDLRTEIQDKNGMTALDWAATKGHAEIVELLKNHPHRN